MRIVSFNCRSIKRSVDYVRILCKQADIIALQETWLMPHDLNFINCIDDNFSAFSKSSVDSSAGILRGRPYGGLTIMWRKSAFTNVSCVECENDRVAAVIVDTSERRRLLLTNVYMPVDSEENLPEFTDTISRLSAIIEESNIETALMVGDFNAHPEARFGKEMLAFCEEQIWNCVDIDHFGIDSNTFTYLSEAHGTTKWLDHCLATAAASKIVLSIHVDNSVSWSDHFPLHIECDIGLMCTKVSNTNNYTAINKNILWCQRNDNEIKSYALLCNRYLETLPVPNKCSNCDSNNAKCDSKCIII